MQSTSATRVNNTVESTRVQVVLLQHWATMVAEQREQLSTATDQIVRLDARATRLYQDGIVLHGLYNEAVEELHYHGNLNLQMSALITRILAENPELPRVYTDLHLAMIDGTADRPIDLTADEELDEEL